MRRIVAVILLFVVALGLVACSKKEPKPIRVEDIRAICELATLECYYNNVAKIDKKADNIFQVDRKMWIEYEGKVTLGIRMSDVQIETKGEKVYITMPKAEVLSSDYSFKENSGISSADGWLVKNKISVKDQQTAVVKAQDKMVESIKDNKEMLLKAESRAKELIENYIVKFGEATGQEYTIVWKN